MKPMIAKPIAQATAIFLNSFASGFVQRWTKRRESTPKSYAPCTTYPIGLLLSVRKGIDDNLDAAMVVSKGFAQLMCDWGDTSQLEAGTAKT
mmetsp:Transcript_155529/g.270554  ORF Transcript_155529/g.270554 Transcript_155529/m.270554 type:complete len:92 (-) Transcript_155529:22-297(-)